MKTKYLIISILIATVTLTGCSEWLDINTNPDKSISSTPEQILPVVVFYASQLQYDHAEYGTYLSGCLTTGGKSQTGTTAYKSGWEFLSMNRHPQWRRHFFDIGVNCEELIKTAEAKQSYNFILIARTIRLMSTQMTTDFFGDMPRSEMFKSIAPSYDTQEDIYKWLLGEANALIADYNNPEYANASTNYKITKSEDRIFAGDMEKWKHFTMALKARILLRQIPNLNNTAESRNAIIEAVDNVLAAGFEEPQYKYDGGSGEKNCPWGSAQPVINGWESRSNQLADAIPTRFWCEDILGFYTESGLPGAVNVSADPRMNQMMQARSGPANTNDSGEKYRYLESNIGMDLSYRSTNYPDLYATTNPLTQNDGYVSLMTKEELLFMKAEAMYWNGDKQGAFDVMMSAIDYNLERWGIDLTSQRVTIYKGKFTLENTSTNRKIKAVSDKNGEKYFPTIDKFNIGHLMRHKYVCMYLQPEQWNDLRRYNYSNITDNNNILYDGVAVYEKLRRPFNLYIPYWINSDTSAPQAWVNRINYDPETEEKYNVNELKRLGAYKNSEWLKKPMIWAVR